MHTRRAVKIPTAILRLSMMPDSVALSDTRYTKEVNIGSSLPRISGSTAGCAYRAPANIG